MIEVLFSKINQIANKITRISKTRGMDIYGAGIRGNVYYGKKEGQVIPKGYETVYNTSDSYVIPFDGMLQYENLFIDTDVRLFGIGDFCTIYVNDTLTLRGCIDLSNTHSGNYSSSGSIPKSLTLIKMLGETEFLPNSDFYITGGTGNPYFGNSTYGGGFCGVYYSKAYDERNNELISIDSNLKVSGGTAAAVNAPFGTCGGCLFVVARKIVLPDEITDTSGRILCCGGNASGGASGTKFIYQIKGTL